MGLFWPQEDNLNKLCRGVKDNVKLQIKLQILGLVV